MSGGRLAKAGFDYQDVVTLEALLDHFQQGGPAARARPEGEDDIVLTGGPADPETVHWLQVKKPRTDEHGLPLELSWTLAEVAHELLPVAIAHLHDSVPPNSRQTFILGDDLAPEVQNAVSGDARENCSSEYVALVHILGKELSALKSALPDPAAKRKTTRFRPEVPAEGGDRERVWSSCRRQVTSLLDRYSIGSGVFEDYESRLREVDRWFISFGDHVHFNAPYGDEATVSRRVEERLTSKYRLPTAVVRNTVFRNLRGYISDVAKIEDKWINPTDLELELRCVWPEMVVFRTPPPLPGDHIERPSVVETLLGAATGPAVEVLGASGAGKTLLAAEAFDALSSNEAESFVFYGEIRPENNLRDVLAGVSFRLRRHDVHQPFALISSADNSEQALFENLARELSKCPKPVALLLDFVEGRGSQRIDAELSRFIRRLKGSRVQFITFSQERTLTGFSDAERTTLGISVFEPPGLQAEEFLTLVSRVQPESASSDSAKQQWREIYQSLSAGRMSGVLPAIADAAARTDRSTFDKLAGSQTEWLSEAERVRFESIRRSSAAKKLVCFFLPFRPEDARDIFPEEEILGAVLEMRSLGLLRQHDETNLEMHETVRTRLASLIAPAVRSAAHKKLAAFYAESDAPIPAIAHLREAGDLRAADAMARENFLKGEHRTALLDYVRDRKVLNAEEIASEIGDDGSWEFRELLRGGAWPEAAPLILDRIRSTPERFDTDYRWAWALSEGYLHCAPQGLFDLVKFALERPAGGSHRGALEWVELSAFRAKPTIDGRMLDLFESGSLETKRQLIPFFLNDLRRQVLAPVFMFLREEDITLPGVSPGTRGIKLQATIDLVEFLAALPQEDNEAVLASPSVQLGVFGDFIWSAREFVSPQCVSILESNEQDDTILANALKLLLALGHPRARDFGDQLLHRSGILQTMAILAIVLQPREGDAEAFENRLRQPDQDIQLRFASIWVLRRLGTSPDRIMEALREGAPNDQHGNRFLVLLTAKVMPFAGAAALLEEELARTTADKDARVLAPTYAKLAELDDDSITDVLLRAVKSPWPSVRAMAFLGLRIRRSTRAFSPIVGALKDEADATAFAIGVVAAACSRPPSMSSFEEVFVGKHSGNLWRYILIGRLRAVDEGHALVDAALDGTRRWQVRRAAILAASKLPHEAAMDRIHEQILNQHFAIPNDNDELTAHALLVGIARPEDAHALQRIFRRGKTRFIAFWQEVYDDWKQQSLGGRDAPGAKSALDWLYDRLAHAGFARTPSAINRVVDELHLPILQAAVIRGLCAQGRHALVEDRLPTAPHDWLVIRSLSDLAKQRAMDPASLEHLKSMVRTRPTGITVRLSNVFSSITPSPPRIKPTKLAEPPITTQSVAIGRKEIELALRTGTLADNTEVQIDSEANFRVLVEELAPENDWRLDYRAAPPKPTLNAQCMLVRGVETSRSDQNSTLRARLRPQVAAANTFGVQIPWHRQCLSDRATAKTYRNDYILAIEATGNTSVLESDLMKNGDLLLKAIDSPKMARALKDLARPTWAGALRRFCSVGALETLRAACLVMAHIDAPEIDDVLANAFERWLTWFSRRGDRIQHNDNHPLWQTFRSLSKHPRFARVPNTELRLMEILQLRLNWVHADGIVAKLLHQPRSYAFLEDRLLHAASFTVFNVDEVDKLDDAADRLFGDVLD